MNTQKGVRLIAMICGLLGLCIIASFLVLLILDARGFVLPVAVLTLLVAAGFLRTAWAAWSSQRSAVIWYLVTMTVLTLTYALISAADDVPRWWLGLPWLVLFAYLGVRILKPPPESTSTSTSAATPTSDEDASRASESSDPSILPPRSKG